MSFMNAEDRGRMCSMIKGWASLGVHAMAEKTSHNKVRLQEMCRWSLNLLSACGHLLVVPWLPLSHPCV